MDTLICWVGFTDIRAARGELDGGLGPIGQIVSEKLFDEALLLVDASTAAGQADVARFLMEVSHGKTQLEFRETGLENPIDFHAIHQLANEALTDVLVRQPSRRVSITLSPGTPAMATVWILLSATASRAIRLFQSSPQRGVEPANLPFDIHAEYVPKLVRAQGRRMAAAFVDSPIDTPGFEDIASSSDEMARVKERAYKVAVHEVPVLILGDSGTGKELFAKAICKASARPDDPVVVNCGAFPSTLLESTLFGYVKGAFTDAKKDTPGIFEAADGGTVFLDEIGEMPLEAQSRLLRVLQEKKVQRVGATVERPVDVRIISATNRNLREAVGTGDFRDDLYYRLAITTIELPPLCERQGDLQLLIDELLPQVVEKLGTKEKPLTPGARNILSPYSWPGNVRELQATLTRALIWSQGERITEADVEDAIESEPISQTSRDLLNRPLGDGFNLDALLEEIKESYARRALDEGMGNKSRAAKLLGQRQQTFWAYVNKKRLA